MLKYTSTDSTVVHVNEPDEDYIYSQNMLFIKHKNILVKTYNMALK
jgi:Tfp pilus assembly protein PilZ